MVVILTIAGTLLSLAGFFGLYLNFKAWRILQANVDALNTNNEILEVLAHQNQQAIALGMMGDDEEDGSGFGLNQ